MAESGQFNSKSFVVQAQKKVFGKIASHKNVAKVFVDDITSNLFDQLYAIAKLDTGNKKEAEKLSKDLIKIAVKIAVLYKNNQFDETDVETARLFRGQFRTTAKTIISFYEVDFTYDRQFLVELLEQAKETLHKLINSHLTPKSHGRIDHVFDYFANGDLLDKLYQNDSYKIFLKELSEGLNKLMESGEL